MRSFDLVGFSMIGVALVAPAVAPILRGSHYNPPVSWKSAFTASFFKVAIAAIGVTVALSSSLRSISSLLGEALYLGSMVGMAFGGGMLLFAGFWTANDSAMARSLRLVINSQSTEPPSVWHIIKWSMIGLFILILSLAVYAYPFEMAKQVVAAQAYHSD